MMRLILPKTLATFVILVASPLIAQAQSGAVKRTLWTSVASVNVPNSVSVSQFQGAYYFSPKSGAIMAAASFEWIDRSGTKTIQRQATETKNYMKSNGYNLEHL